MSETQSPLSICVVCDNTQRYQQACEFSEQQHLALLDEKDSAHDLQLIFGEQRTELYDRQLNTSIYVDFVHGALAHRQQFGGGRGQAIAKAIGLKQGNNPTVLDATAGLARDAYILATLGCKMTLVEQSPILSNLIEDGIKRGLEDEQCAQILSTHFNLINQNAIEYMNTLSEEQRPDVIYIDPMYPERKKSALVKKDMQILQHLLGKTDDDEALLKAALGCAKKRVVVKRPSQAEPVGQIKPGSSVNSKKTRYDLYTGQLLKQ